MNNCTFIGRLTKPAELRYTQSNKAVASFTLAVDRKYKDASGNKQTDFIQCVAWGKTGEIITQHTDKGSQLGIVGELNSRSYENKEGRNVTVWEVNVQSFDFIGGKPGGGSGGSASGNSFADSGKPIDISDDDLPF